MLLLFSILGGIVLLLLLLLFTGTLLGLDYLYDNKVHQIKIRVRLLYIPVSVNIPLAKKENGKQEEKKPLKPKEYIALAKDIYRAYGEMENEWKELLWDLKRLASCRELAFSVHYGTKNPALTGILNGAVWTASSLILKILDNTLGCLKKELNVYPDFQQECVSIHMKGTFCFRLFRAIQVVLKLKNLVKIMKSKIKTETKKDGV
ncbi:MAG: DUF2953 domain-containing protein [Clostridia bacterium]|nr:DUF2953 domain-containing protein [Clostridia bacterium]